MRTLILLLFSIIVTSCDHTAKLTPLIHAGLQTGERSDRAFLGCTFGEPRRVVESRLDSLYQSGAVLKDESGQWYYEFADSGPLEKITWFLQPMYHNDSLSAVNLFSFSNHWDGNTYSPLSVYDELRDMLITKYGDPVYVPSSSHAHWLQNNLLITLSSRESDVSGLGRQLRLDYKDTSRDIVTGNFQGSVRFAPNSLDTYEQWYYDSIQVLSPTHSDL